MAECNTPIQGRRRIFWVTQPEACGVVSDCHAECGSSGLRSFVPEGQQGRTFDTTEFVRGLAINILFTDARKESRNCGYNPGAIAGHWSDSFRDDGQRAGTNLRDIPAQKSVADSVKLIQATMQFSLQKLVSYGVARSVSVAVKYAGGNNFIAETEIIGMDGKTSKVGVTGTRMPNAWVWGTN